MDPLRNEDDQIQALKNWWKENGVSTVLSVAVAIAAVLGWRGWQAQQEARTEAAAFAYQDMLETFVATQQNPDDIAIAEAMHKANTLKEEFGGTGYAHFGALVKAKQAVIDKDYDQAERELRWVVEDSDSEELREIAKIRLARAMLAAGKTDEALQALELDRRAAGAVADALEAQRAELAGDIYVARNEYSEALAQYSAAQSLTADGAVRLPLLETKLGYVKSLL